MSHSIHSNIAVSPDSDKSLRMFLANQGDGRKGHLSDSVEEAVRIHIFDLTAEQAKAANANISQKDLSAIVEEAVEWARHQQGLRRSYL